MRSVGWSQRRPDLVLPDLPLFLVREQHHYEVTTARGIGDRLDLEPVCLRLVDRARVGPALPHGRAGENLMD